MHLWPRGIDISYTLVLEVQWKYAIYLLPSPKTNYIFHNNFNSYVVLHTLSSKNKIEWWKNFLIIIITFLTGFREGLFLLTLR